MPTNTDLNIWNYKLLENGKKVYEEYFTLEGMFKNIIKRIKQ